MRGARGCCIKRIEKDGAVYAILVSEGSFKQGAVWIGDPIESLQGQRIEFKAGKEFRTHHHILNPRTIKRTQEAFIVISGRIQIDVYDNTPTLLGSLSAGPGEAIFVYRGGHGVKIIEDAVAYECKAGQYTCVSEDKEFLND